MKRFLIALTFGVLFYSGLVAGYAILAIGKGSLAWYDLITLLCACLYYTIADRILVSTLRKQP